VLQLSRTLHSLQAGGLWLDSW